MGDGCACGCADDAPERVARFRSICRRCRSCPVDRMGGCRRLVHRVTGPSMIPAVILAVVVVALLAVA